MAKILREEAMRLFASALVLLVTAFPLVSSASTPTAEIPFEFRDGLLWVAVKVPQNPKPLHFLLDSGANVSVINLRTARELGLRLGQRVEVRGVGAITEGYWPERLAAKVGDVRLARDYLAMDLEGLGRVCNRPIDGLIG